MLKMLKKLKMLKMLKTLELLLSKTSKNIKNGLLGPENHGNEVREVFCTFQNGLAGMVKKVHLLTHTFVVIVVTISVSGRASRAQQATNYSI